MDDLTKEQQKILVSMYKEVLSRQPALSFDDANYFQNSDEVMRLFSPEQTSEHMSALCWKLKSKGYILCFPGDNLANDIELTDQTIIYMENKFKNNLKKHRFVSSSAKTLIVHRLHIHCAADFISSKYDVFSFSLRKFIACEISEVCLHGSSSVCL